MDGINLYNQFLFLHKPQLEVSGIPEIFWETLYKKLTHQTFDAGCVFSLLLIDYGEEDREETDPVWTVIVSKPDGIDHENGNEIYLIDHAWTFRNDQVRFQLRNIPQLSQRMARIMGFNEDDENLEQNIVKNMWKYCQSYSINTDGLQAEDRVPIWYIMDELGSGINHSDTPNFRVVPFFHIAEQTTYSLLFPIKSCDEGEQVTRDFIEGAGFSGKERSVLLLPWQPADFKSEDYKQTEPEEAYFSEGHIPESIPEGSLEEPFVDTNRPLRVYSEYDVIREFLTDPAFELVNYEHEADILWLTKHYKTFAELNQESPNKFINQFPCEYVITIKDLLSIVCRRKATKHSDDQLETYPKWLPTTYNLKTELVKFASYFQHRQDKGLDNHWIVKPFNLARSLDTHITNNLSYIMRLPLSGPKIAQKYIENPVLFDRPEVGKVKFDIRYVILLKSIEPLEAYVYTNFFLRFANKPFALTDFDDYEKHFTVMNYTPNAELHHVRCADFINSWQDQYPAYPWNDIEADICNMLKEIFEAATQRQPPCGIAPFLQSRAVYAADIMLAWDGDKMQPKILEINWTPDCKRACQYYPDFFNDIFKLLFLNEINDEAFRVVSN